MNEKARRAELAQFLRTRRERISPQQVGLPPGTRRRTPGLRREELALLAGVGATWYTWLEQGRAITVSGQVLESLARVLQLDADEQAHLFILARQQLPADPLPLTQTIDPALQLILDTMGIYPALVLSPRWDIIAWNQAACRMFADFSTMTTRERHILWFLFIDPRHRAMAVDWEREALLFLALFRASTQRYVGEAWLTELVNDLKQVSPAFREGWSRYDVQGVQTEHKRLIHPLVGLLVLQAKTFQVADHPDLQMIVYTPVSGTDTAAKLAVLSESLSAK
ncbi:MAG TPA: helix-turn-helix transcriptional regulator [Ktedonobacteraceae bacterium]|jgi:transcriptional regulator with XRE-family HTH domain|nr:helix-turn-helix transcriptional regulator [Ktedonobacteraceae bacterium]